VKNRYWSLYFLLAFPVFVATAQEAPMTYSDGLVSSNAVLPPAGTFLLVRKNDFLCAIRFTGIWRGNDAGEGSIFRSGDESFRAHYEWYSGGKTSSHWVINPPVEAGKGEVSQRRLVGLGRFAFGGGNIHIKCGSLLLKWSAPAHVYFYHALAQDEGIEIAITNWTKFEDIDPNNHRLRWLRFDSNRATTVIKGSAASQD
jgi:hypothetical protein